MPKTEKNLIKKIKDNFSGKENNIKRLVAILFISFFLMSFIIPEKFLSISNFKSMGFQVPEFALLASGIMIAMVAGGIDLSVISTANLSGILAALAMTNLPIENDFLLVLIALLIILVTGALCGLFNGLLIGGIGITPLLATLGTMELYKGIAIVITGGSAVSGFPESFVNIGNSSVFNIPFSFILTFLILFIIFIILNKTTFGFKLYLMGDNETSSRFTGFDNMKIKIKTHILSGMLASLAGLIIISKSNSAKADYGSSYLLPAILVVVMGGTNVNGGYGKVVGIGISVLALQFLTSGFNIMRFSPFFSDFVWGFLLLFIMVINYYFNKKAA